MLTMLKSASQTLNSSSSLIFGFNNLEKYLCSEENEKSF